MQIFELNGIMVDTASADDPFVKSGTITGCAELAWKIANCHEDLTLKINSYGGSVEGATRIGVALADRQGSKTRVEVGAICASAAANLLATLPRQTTILVHPETMIMYHSCAGVVEGTPTELRDNADRMDKYNAVIIDRLTAGTSLDEATVRTWFEAGREGWLTGMEAVKCGLADGYVNTDFNPAPSLPPKEGAQGWEYAAIAAIAKHVKEIAVMDTEKIIEKEVELEKPIEQEPAVEDTELEVKTEAEGEELEPKAEEQADELAALKAENEELKEELAALKATCEKLTAGLKAPATKAVRKTFAQMVREIPTDISQREYAQRFTALKNEHKAEYDAYMKAHSATVR